MLKLDRYLLGDFVQSFLATLIVLLVVSVGGVLVDILGNIADGRLPAKLLFSQLGLQFIAYLPLILPLALMLGLLLAIARLYRDSEMAVITAIGVGPKRLLRPLLMLVVPVVALVGACSLWLGPWAGRVAEQMIIEANRSVLMERLAQCCLADRSGAPHTLVVLNIDRFKLFNQSQGHLAGDRVLLAFAAKLRAACNRHDGADYQYDTNDAGFIPWQMLKFRFPVAIPF